MIESRLSSSPLFLGVELTPKKDTTSKMIPVRPHFTYYEKLSFPPLFYGISYFKEDVSELQEGFVFSIEIRESISLTGNIKNVDR